jgi:hypothetical protein
MNWVGCKPTITVFVQSKPPDRAATEKDQRKHVEVQYQNYLVISSNRNRFHGMIMMRWPLHIQYTFAKVLSEGKVVLSYEDVWGSGGIAPSFLTSALEKGEWSDSRPGRFIRREKAPIPTG